MMSAFVEKAMELAQDLMACTVPEYIDAENALRAHLEAREAVTQRIAKALTRLCKSFPSDFDMHEAGWDGSEIEEACSAYDAARAAIQAYDEASK